MGAFRFIALPIAAVWLALTPAAQAQPARIDVWIDAVLDVAATEGACGDTEYFARVSFDRRRLVRTPLHSIDTGGAGIIGGFDFTPGGWIAPFVTTLTRPLQIFTVRVALIEKDGGLCFGNDQVDITPARGKTLVFGVLLGTDGRCRVVSVPGRLRERLPCGVPFTVRRVAGCRNCSGVTLRVFRLL